MNSPELAVLLKPRETFAELALGTKVGRWWRRPLLLAVMIGCALSLLATRTLSPRLVAGETLAWSFVPLFQIAAFAVVWRWFGGTVRFGRAIDLFFITNAPWLLWLIGFATATSFAAPMTAYSWMATSKGLARLLSTAALAAVWSLWLELWFYRTVFGCAPQRSVAALVLQRLLAGLAAVFYVFWLPLWPLLVWRFGGATQ